MKKILDYLKTYIDDDVSMKNWDNEAKMRLSLTMASSFNFYLLNILETDFILLEPLESFTVDKLEKEVHNIETQITYPCVFALKRISTYMLKKFIKDKIAKLKRN